MTSRTPRGRAALYDKCVAVLLESWRKGLYEQRPAQPFDPRAAQRVLAQLAWWMHCQSEDQAEGKLEREEDRRGSPSAPNQDMAKVVASTLAETAPGAGLGRDGRRFLERMIVYDYWPWGALAPKLRINKPSKKAVLITSSAMPSLIGRLFTGALRALNYAAASVGAKKAGTLLAGIASLHEKQYLTEKERRKARALGRLL